ncbi:MFS transporter [Plantactinospora siamensis]|uniref:MFS transporter n=1 Tax=Plantactinospora siamensis TaxID=555372 RepID=A0ABV6NTY8_9ACTN
MTAVREPRARAWAPPLLRDPPFRRYWSGQTVSLLGDQITEIALPLLAVLVAHAGPAQMGYLTAAALLPNLLFSLVAGAWADRRADKRRIMILADLGRAAALLAVPTLYLTGRLALPVLYLIAFAVGTLSVAFEVCRSTLFASLVNRRDYLAANALLNGSRAFSFVAGTSAGGLLVQFLTAPVALLVDGLSYLYSAWAIARVRVTEPAPPTERGLAVGRGLSFLARSPVMRALVCGSTTLNLFNYMFHALFILYATRYLRIAPGVLGVALGVASIGSLLGATLARRLADRFGVGRTLVASYLLFPAPLILIPLATGPHALVLATLCAAEFLSGAGVMVLDIVGGSVQTSVVPDGLRARVSGAYRTLNYGIRPIGAVLGGALGAALGVRTGLWIATVGATAGTGWLLASPIPRLHRL